MEFIEGLDIESFIEMIRSGIMVKAIVRGITFAVSYDLVKHVTKKIWYEHISRKKRTADLLCPCDFGKEQGNLTFDDKKKGITSVLKDCYPEALLTTFEKGSGKILKAMNPLESIDDFYNTSRAALMKSKNKEILLFRHNSFDIIKNDYTSIIESLERGNKIKITVSGTIKNLQESTLKELDFLQKNPLAQKLLLEMDKFSYSCDFELNLLLSCVDSLLSLILLLDIMRRGHGKVVISLNNAYPSLRGQIIEEGKMFFVKFPKQAPEYLGESFSSKNNELQNQILMEMSQMKPVHLSNEEDLTEKIKIIANHIQYIIEKNWETGSITLKRKTALEEILDSFQLHDTSQIQISQNALEKAHQEFLKAVLGNELKLFKMYKFWQEYKAIEEFFSGDFDRFLEERKRFSIRNREIKNSGTRICFFPSRN